MIFNNYSIVTSLHENIIIGYSSNIYVSKMYIMCFTWNIWAVCMNKRIAHTEGGKRDRKYLIWIQQDWNICTA